MTFQLKAERDYHIFYQILSQKKPELLGEHDTAGKAPALIAESLNRNPDHLKGSKWENNQEQCKIVWGHQIILSVRKTCNFNYC